jgi:hypothetical protein
MKVITEECSRGGTPATPAAVASGLFAFMSVMSCYSGQILNRAAVSWTTTLLRLDRLIEMVQSGSKAVQPLRCACASKCANN